MAAKARSKTLPPIPGTVWSALGPVTVERVDAIPNEDGTKSAAYGDVNFYTRTIRVRRDLAPEAAWVTLLHERIHLILEDGCAQLTDEQEERVTDLIATALVAEMVAARR